MPEKDFYGQGTSTVSVIRNSRLIDKMVKQISAESAKYMEKVRFLHLRAIYSCNLSCPYCVMSAQYGDSKTDAMKEDQALEILRFFLANTSLQKIGVEISGGEPLLCGNQWMAAVCNGLREMEKQYDKDLYITITTNCTLMTEEVISTFRECNTNISVGVDAPDSASGGLKTLDLRVREGIELLQKHYRMPAINAVATRLAIHHVEKFIDELKELNVQVFRLTAVNSRGRALEAPWLMPTTEEEVDCTMRLIHYMDNYDFSIMETTALDRIYRFFGDMFEPNFCHNPTCPAGIGFIAVDLKGDIYPCGNETRERFIMGNLYDGFDETRSHQILSAYHNKQIPLIRCAFCKASRICYYGCPGCMHENDTNHFDSECRLAQKLYERFENDRPLIEGLYKRAKTKITRFGHD